MGMLRDILLWLYWYPGRLIVGNLPLPLIYRLAGFGGKLLAQLARGKGKRLAAEYDRLPAAVALSREQAVRGAFVKGCQMEAEVLIYNRLSPATIAGAVSIEGLELLDAALAAGNGVMLLFGHFGANQMVMPAIGHRGYPMNQLSAPAVVWQEVLAEVTFSPMQKRAMEIRWAQEQSLPVRHINVFGSLKEAFRCLKRNEVLGVAVDGGGGTDRIECPFLGRRALFAAGPLEIARRTGCTVLPVFMVRQGDGHNRMVIHPALPLSAGAGDGDGLRHFLALFETYILRHPDQYLNFLALRSFMAARGDSPLFLE